MTAAECQRYGIQALRALGGRQAELDEMSSLSVATIKRYMHVLPEELSLRPAKLRGLNDHDRHVLTGFWVDVIVAKRPLGVPRGRRFLDVFCPVCVDREPVTHDPNAWEAGPEPPNFDPEPSPIERNLHMVTPAELARANAEGVHHCVRGDHCVSGAARFAALCAHLRVRPWPAYEWIRDHVGPQTWWKRTCLGTDCDQVFASPGSHVRRCRACAPLGEGDAVRRPAARVVAR